MNLLYKNSQNVGRTHRTSDGLTERLNKYEFPSNVKVIPLGQKRKPGRPKTTVECLEFQPGEQ
ncbi:hypothetical protein BpHYR1_028661, partial [Brachionus plicatilis]